MKKIKKYYGYVFYEFKDDYVHLFNLYVYKKYRGNGLSRKLLEQAISEIRETGWEKEISIVAICRENCMTQEQLVDFYTRMGLDVYCYYG